MKKTAKMGYVYEVANKDPKFGANLKYYAINIEDETGKNEKWGLFTKCEFDKHFTRLNSPSDWLVNMLKTGRAMPMDKNGSGAYVIKLIAPNPAAYHVTSRIISKGFKRAATNPEDIPYKSKIQDMLD